MKKKRCRRHAFIIQGMRQLAKPIRRGQQRANVESYEQCCFCGKERRTGLEWMQLQSQATGQEHST